MRYAALIFVGIMFLFCVRGSRTGDIKDLGGILIFAILAAITAAKS